MRLHRKRIAAIAMVVVATTLGGAFAYHNLCTESGSSDGPGHERLASNFPPLNPNGSELVVRAFTIENGDNCETHSFTGSLQPRYQTSVGFRIAGKISERCVELGERVTKGQILFRLNPEDAELQLRVAEADQVSADSLLVQTKAEEVRLAQLRASGAVSMSDYDLAVASRDVAKARLDAANRRLELARNQRTYCDLAADNDGLVTAIHAEAGQVVNIGQPVLNLMQRNEQEAVVHLPEGLVAAVKSLDAQAVFWSRPDVRLKAELRELSPVADSMSRTYEARFRLLNAPSDLAIGMTVSIQLQDSKEQGTAIPLASVSSRNSLPVVWRIDPASGGVEPVDIEVVQYRSEQAIIRSSLQAGDRIVSAGVQRIDEKSKVRVWEPKQ